MKLSLKLSTVLLINRALSPFTKFPVCVQSVNISRLLPAVPLNANVQSAKQMFRILNFSMI